MSAPQAIVVVPARDEQARIARCIEALAGQRGVAPDSYELIVVLNRCTDATGERARAAARRSPALRLELLECCDEGVGAARRMGMDAAAARLVAANAPRGLIVTTDADTVVAPDWLAAQLGLAAAGAAAIAGDVELDHGEAALLPPAALAARRDRARARLRDVLSRSDPAALTEHHHFSGASLAVTADTYLAVGGLPVRAALEDEAFGRALEERGVTIHRSRAVRVTTSARTDGRAARGLARDLAVAAWRARRSFSAASFDVGDLVRRKQASVSVILPAREVAGTIGGIVTELDGLRRAGLVDELLVVDAASADGTARIAAARGATVLQEDELLTEFGPARGKGDAMWRALSAASGEIVVYADADTTNFSAGYISGLLGPLLTAPEIDFVKGAFRRPLRVGELTVDGEGGRVTELVARPLLNLYAPQLAGFDQPLAGELAARRELLEQLAFPAGYGVEIAMLIDTFRMIGVERMAQVDLGVRQNRHQSLRALSAMAYSVSVAALSRLADPELRSRTAPGPLAFPPADGGLGMEVRQVAVDERPPLRVLHRSAVSPSRS